MIYRIYKILKQSLLRFKSLSLCTSMQSKLTQLQSLKKNCKTCLHKCIAIKKWTRRDWSRAQATWMSTSLREAWKSSATTPGNKSHWPIQQAWMSQISLEYMFQILSYRSKILFQMNLLPWSLNSSWKLKFKESRNLSALVSQSICLKSTQLEHQSTEI